MLELGRTEEETREMDKLTNEDHTHIATEKEHNGYRGNWWIRSNFVGSDTMPIRHRADFKEALSTLRRLKNQEDQAYQIGGKTFPHLGGNDKIVDGIPRPIIRGMILKINLMQNYSDYTDNSQQQFTLTEGCV